jgi:hypothetical protein
MDTNGPSFPRMERAARTGFPVASTLRNGAFVAYQTPL